MKRRTWIVGLVVMLGGWTELSLAETITTDKMKLEFDGGWLMGWENRETGEKIDFGKPTLSTGKEDSHYRPGCWWVDWKKSSDPAAAKVETKYNKLDQTAATIQQRAVIPNGEVQALQWGIRVPYDRIQAVHWPRGLAPARLSGFGYPKWVKADYYFGGRTAFLIGGSGIRHHYYVIQGKTGGLLIYMENPDLHHHMALEIKHPDNKSIIISNRSIMPPPWKNSYVGGRWVVRQYNGGVNVAAQIYQNYIVKAFDLVPLEKRPTAWVRDVVFTQVNDFLRGPLPAPGFRQPNQNYLSGEAWRKSMDFHTRWLEEMAKVVEPSKVMFYITDWRQDGMDIMFPNTDVDPYFAFMIAKARKMGFHVMLHMHNHLVHGQTTFWKRYLAQSAKIKGQDPEKSAIEGVGVDAISKSSMISKNKISGSTWDARKGLERKMDWYLMNPAHEGFRYLMVGNILSAVRATGADAIHLDVPNIWVDLRSELYGMNQMQGQREFYKLLRQTLDENGFAHVAIATEVTPFEGFMKYVDFAQNSRDSSAKKRAAQLLEGSNVAGEALLANQNDQDWAALVKEHQNDNESKSKDKKRQVDQKALLAVLEQARDLGEPSIDAMVSSPFVQGYPHLGAYPGDLPLAQHLAQWYSFTHDVMPHRGGSYDFSKPLPPFEIGKLALARFMDKEGPHFMRLAAWQPGDIARYQLKDGRVLRVFRTDAATIRLAFADGKVLAELDLLKGWKNDQLLMKGYSPVTLLPVKQP